MDGVERKGRYVEGQDVYDTPLFSQTDFSKLPVKTGGIITQHCSVVSIISATRTNKEPDLLFRSTQ